MGKENFEIFLKPCKSGEGGIRTHGRFPFKRFRVVRFRPLSHLSKDPLGLRHSKDRSAEGGLQVSTGTAGRPGRW